MAGLVGTSATVPGIQDSHPGMYEGLSVTVETPGNIDRTSELIGLRY